MNKPILALICAALASGGVYAAGWSVPMLLPAEADVAVLSAKLLNPTTVELSLKDGQKMYVDFYGENILRLFQDPEGGPVRSPQATPPADILVANPRKALTASPVISQVGQSIDISTPDVRVSFAKSSGLVTIIDLRSGKTVLEQSAPVSFGDGVTSIKFAEKPGEYFFGGGVQNGRFSHKGRSINIVNENSWTDGGVCSPAPMYWSTGGYGIMWHTFDQGRYDFGAETPGTVELSHNTGYLDLFVSVDATPVALLNDFYQLTGNPVLLPKFGFYEGHLNAYNRDYWTPDSTNGQNRRSVLMDDGKYYLESQKNNGGIRESLNGELPGNYQFSARAVVDRYANADMPLGWILPNDGYGAGYGQTSSLEGNVENLKQFGDYARSKGVEIGLWTQSDLHPKKGIEPLLQRDIVREVRDAGVRVLKTDVAWVGYGYSFGLNGVADVAEIMPYYGNDARPFIISLDGWAGTQRYAGIWSGDQTGGEWEYIRFHIPTYIGSGLAGNPNITSDMDGIFGGKQPAVNIRDFQWKTFTPMQLNMDGWGSNPKYPQALGEPATSINRNYLKLKSELLPYAYTYAREAVDGKPLIRAMFIDYPNEYTMTAATRYQYLYGPDFLVAPVYQATAADEQGNDRRDGIYLPEGKWVDYFNGNVYEGNRVINNFEAPIWKLPLFVRQGAIIPLANPNNNPSQIRNDLRIYELYPAAGRSEMTQYDDDGTTEQYRAGIAATTPIAMNLNDKGVLTVEIGRTSGTFDGFHPEKMTELRINASEAPRSVEATVGGKKVKLERVNTPEEWANGSGNMWYYEAAPELNRFSTPATEAAGISVKKNPQILVRLAATNIAENAETVTVKGYTFDNSNKLLGKTGTLTAPTFASDKSVTEPYALVPHWNGVTNADYYEIDHNGMTYSTISVDSLRFTDLRPETDYTFRIRSVNADGTSPWADFAMRTADNPLEYAIHGIRGRTSQPDEAGFEVYHLFDFVESGDAWFSKYWNNAIPNDLTIDLVTVNNIDKFHYLPHPDAGNGTILSGTVTYSLDGNNWSEPVEFSWNRDARTKVFEFPEKPLARYIRLHIDKGVGNYTSGRELYVFRAPGTESYLQGDINKDGKIDDNDFTSYMNYTGLRRSDSDFDYVAIGDINGNGLIDAYDISTVGIELDGGIPAADSIPAPVAGTIELTIPRHAVNAGQEISITVRGKDLKNVNALSFALPYDAESWEYIGIEPTGMKDMVNLTYDRLHTNGSKVLYPTFVNRGNKPELNGSEVLMTIRFKARKKGTFKSQAEDIVLVDRLMRLRN